ncbi:MAG: methionine biosynthesis protein MetW [Deltaproteobacteria bacterium RIFOXYD12_FULL_50_9]|nr:MAG: methionine biosynthesis protein MetW [Deltaproteobacteria bacterium RIFOXYD12_FULL_50_9]
MRFDLQIIASWITPGAKVLDLGCGEGDLLSFLKEQKQVYGTGIECQESKVAQCIAAGLPVLQGDINSEVEDYPDKAFDYVILSQTLQQVFDPEKLIHAMLRIGGQAIVSFPNFSHWRNRLQLLTTGYAPKNRQLPFEWYNTPNIRVITLNDFRRFARLAGFTILKEVAINTDHHNEDGNIINHLAGLRATYGIFMIGKGH